MKLQESLAAFGLHFSRPEAVSDGLPSPGRNLQKQIHGNYSDIEKYNSLRSNFPLFCNTFTHTAPKASTVLHYKAVIKPLQVAIGVKKQNRVGIS